VKKIETTGDCCSCFCCFYWFSFIPAKTNKKREEVAKIVNEWIGKEIPSCGCTNVKWEKQPVEQGQTAKISVEMTPEETGHFSKTVEVYCNVKESPVKLTLIGITE